MPQHDADRDREQHLHVQDLVEGFPHDVVLGILTVPAAVAAGSRALQIERVCLDNRNRRASAAFGAKWLISKGSWQSGRIFTPIFRKSGKCASGDPEAPAPAGARHATRCCDAAVKASKPRPKRRTVSYHTV
jgi:hypothetical protein